MATSPVIPNTEQVGSQPSAGGGLFSKIGAALKNIGPYIVPAANRLAAAAGNYGPLEEEHRQRQEALTAQLASSNLQNPELNRQLLTKQIANVRSPEETAAAGVEQAGKLEDVKVLHGPSTNIISPIEGGGARYVENTYDPATGQRVNRPKMMTEQVPNPALAPYAPDAPKPNYVQDWNAGPPPTMPKTVPQTSEVPAMLKASGAPVVEPTTMNSSTGLDHVWYSNGREV